MTIDEWHTVAIDKNHKGYAWGEMNDNPWYYRSATTYAVYMFVISVLFVSGIVSILITLFKKKKALALKIALYLWAFLVVLFLSGHSESL